MKKRIINFIEIKYVKLKSIQIFFYSPFSQTVLEPLTSRLVVKWSTTLLPLLAFKVFFLIFKRLVWKKNSLPKMKDVVFGGTGRTN